MNVQQPTDQIRVTRRSLPLTPRDLEDLALMRASIAHREALMRLARTVVTEESSEASFLHAVLEAGIRAVQEQAEEAGYAQMAAARDEEADRTVARRRLPHWADE